MSGMEATLVSSMLKIVGSKLAPLVIKELTSIAGVTKDLQELQDQVEEINIWLQTVGDKSMKNDRASNWLKKLKDATYDAEDLVNEFHIEAEKCDSSDGVKNVAVKYLWTKPKSAMFEWKIAHKIKEIKRSFAAIVRQRSDYSTIANSMPVDCPVPYTSKTIGEVPLWTIVDETSIFGRDQERNMIISELTQTNDQQRIKIVSVIGLGGSGKTTLAKLIFNDGNIINKHFEVLLWVHVSREFAVEKLVEKLFESISGDKPDQLPLQRVSRTISDKLAGKRFLAILDDVWTEDRVDWERFMVHLKSGAPGSSILLTTRSRKVAEAVDSTYTYDIPFLSAEDSWKVFHQCFGISMKALDAEFLKVGTEIVNKCGGVPLAIKVIAGILHGMKGIEEWQSIRDSNLLDVDDDEHRVFACLWLSYFHLPHHLKHCFIHCSMFPRGYVISRRHLISQWIAHGFVPTNQAQLPEDIGIGYFDSLLKGGFLQDQDLDWLISGDVTCKMHDLVHDLARQIVKDEFVSEIEATDQIKRCVYLSLTSCTGKLDSKLFDKVRALYISGRSLTLDKKMNKQRCVRTIILKHISVTSLPIFVSKFEHLGYLEISRVDCEALPEAISNCWNLQAMHVQYCTRLAVLPESIGKLKKLRTLELTDAPNVRSLPQSIGDCDNLRSLYIVSCGIKLIPTSIGDMVNLRVLCIVRCMELDALPESLGKLCKLQTISLSRSWSLEHLPQCITSLCHLEYVDLSYCSNLVELPEGIGNLRNLKVLNLKSCDKLCGLPAGFGQLTRLQQLGLFIVGDSVRCARISELEKLDMLNGELRIENIIYVKDPSDAEKACLKEKNGIRKLSLYWYSEWGFRAIEEAGFRPLYKNWYSKLGLWDSDMEEELLPDTEKDLLPDTEKDLPLLNFLEPPSRIEKLRINGYQGPQLPSWMVKQNDSYDLCDSDVQSTSSPSQFCHLTKLVLENFSNLEHLPELVGLPALMILKLRGMPKLLELLTVTTGLARGEEGDEMQYCFPRLSTLVISQCPKLSVRPHFPPSLQSLTLEGSNEQLLSSGCFFHLGDEPSSSSCIKLTAQSLAHVKRLHPLRELKLGRLIGSSPGWDVLQHLTGLHALEISHCRDLTRLPESMKCLTCLRRLVIKYCDNLCVLPEWLRELQSLQNLWIEGLEIMSILPQSIQGLTSLEFLTISNCTALQQLPEQLEGLCSLHHLEIIYSPALTHLPESMQCLTSLRSLKLCGCEALTHLPESLGELSALRRLHIQTCDGLTSLPHFIQRLALEELKISYIPELFRRCREGLGEDWHLVSHIPYLVLES
ncbi:hypothetical protein BS78_08G125000 [Paspalum vaginatum]|nr:hypothetical protein BS78_08G125000 [Paspalum vaginatum]